MDEVFYTDSPEQTRKIGQMLAKRLKNGSFVALYGELGAGKTAFVSGIADVICPRERVFSPTYTIVNEYLSGDIPLYHFDLYRITDELDLYSTGFYDYIEHGICVCEWCENIPKAVPDGAVRVKIEKTLNAGEVGTGRKITFFGEKS